MYIYMCMYTYTHTRGVHARKPAQVVDCGNSNVLGILSLAAVNVEWTRHMAAKRENKNKNKNKRENKKRAQTGKRGKDGSGKAARGGNVCVCVCVYQWLSHPHTPSPDLRHGQCRRWRCPWHTQNCVCVCVCVCLCVCVYVFV